MWWSGGLHVTVARRIIRWGHTRKYRHMHTRRFMCNNTIGNIVTCTQGDSGVVTLGNIDICTLGDSGVLTLGNIDICTKGDSGVETLGNIDICTQGYSDVVTLSEI